jgi:hypothetical protein
MSKVFMRCEPFETDFVAFGSTVPLTTHNVLEETVTPLTLAFGSTREEALRKLALTMEDFYAPDRWTLQIFPER